MPARTSSRCKPLSAQQLAADSYVVNTIGSVSAVTGSPYGTQGSTTTPSPAAASAQLQAAGLPPVNLANAATQNTVNASLVSGLLGVDPNSVSGVYGGAASTGANIFSNLFDLPILSSLSGATAEQALVLLGLQTPTTGTASAASGTTGQTAASSADTMDAWNAATLDPSTDPATNWTAA